MNGQAETILRIRAMRETGDSVGQIASTLGVSWNVVRTH